MNCLKCYVHEQEFVCVDRRRPGQSRIHGYVLDVSDSLALMHAFHDFTAEGYVIFRLDDIKKVRADPNERHWHRMLSGEGLLGGLSLGFRPDLTSMSAAVESVWWQYHHIIVECEDDEDPIEDFYIGYPLAVGPGGIIFRHFDARGRWYSMPAVIKVPEITIVQFDTPYINHFTKYLDETESV